MPAGMATLSREDWEQWLSRAFGPEKVRPPRRGAQLLSVTTNGAAVHCTFSWPDWPGRPAEDYRMNCFVPVLDAPRVQQRELQALGVRFSWDQSLVLACVRHVWGDLSPAHFLPRLRFPAAASDPYLLLPSVDPSQDSLFTYDGGVSGRAGGRSRPRDDHHDARCSQNGLTVHRLDGSRWGLTSHTAFIA